MFYYINGKVTEFLPNVTVIDCGGVGFMLNTSSFTMSRLRQGEKTKLYVYSVIREDCFDLYGFATLYEKHCFELLVSVSGVGPRVALSILSSTSAENLALSIMSGNEKVLTAAPGVGKRIAQRIVMELKDKISKEMGMQSGEDITSAVAPAAVEPSKLRDATAALTVLGYSPQEIAAALKSVDCESLSIEEIVKQSLRLMLR